MSKRTQFSDVVIDENGDALADIEVTVYPVGDTDNESTIYSTRAGGGTLANPITTTSTGLVQFFANPGTYDLYFSDTELPARISDRTVTWEAVSGDTVDGGVDGDQIADGEIGSAHLATSAVTNTKIGAGAVTAAKISELPMSVHQQTSAKAYAPGGAGVIPGLQTSALTAGWWWCMAGLECESGTTSTNPEFQIELNAAYTIALAKGFAEPSRNHSINMAGLAVVSAGGVIRVTFNGNGANLSGNAVRGWLTCIRLVGG